MFSLDEEEMPIEFYYLGGPFFYRTHSKFSVVFHAVWDSRGLDDTHAQRYVGPSTRRPAFVSLSFFQWDSFRIQVGYGVMVSIDKTRGTHGTKGGGQCHRTQTRTRHEDKPKVFDSAIIIPSFLFFFSLPTDGRMECLSRKGARLFLVCLLPSCPRRTGNILR